MNAKTRTHAKPKKPYAAPRLVRYGEVRVLTQSGSNAAPENMAMMMPSDRAIKENVLQVGVHPLGIGLYLFDYKPEYRDRYGHGRQFGVMAQEVETVVPLAVFEGPRGHKIVDYAMLAIRRDRA